MGGGTVKRISEKLKQLLCDHDWLRSRYVNIQTGENLGYLCAKCGKWKP